MRISVLAFPCLAAGALAIYSEDPLRITLRDIGVHDPAAQDVILSLRDLGDEDQLSHHLRARDLDNAELKMRAIATEVTNRSQALLERRMAMAEALAKGAGGGKPSKPKNPKDQSPGSSGDGSGPDLKGLSPDAQKAQKVFVGGLT